MKKIICSIGVGLSCMTGIVFAKMEIPIQLVTPAATQIGTVTAENTKHGLLLTPALKQLPPGIHGFHIHVHASCDHAAKDAGSHLDPKKTEKHLGPYEDKGHLGDLPALTVNADGTASLAVLAPRLKEKDLKGHTLMVHAGGDNYSDNPAPLGGGGDRIACGVIK